MEKSLAILDLAIGINLKAGKNVSAIQNDKKVIAKKFSTGLNREILNKAGGFYPNIHHIKPREFGGTNNFWNLTPVQRKTHQHEFNSFWRNM